VAAVMVAALGGLGSRLAFLHLGPNEEMRLKVLNTRQREDRIAVRRGRVMDRRGEILAMDIPTKDVWADPKQIIEEGHVRFIGTHLARILQLDPAMVFSRLNRPHRRFEYIKRFVHSDKADQLKRMQLTGVHFNDTMARTYPHGSLMCHVVGFSNLEGVGSAGIEQRLDSYLRSSPGLRISTKDAIGREIYGRRNLEIPAHEGLDVYLTLDMRIQYIVETHLDKAMEEHHAKAAHAIVQDVRTGEILAMASRPEYDLNDFRHSEPEQRRNGAIGVVYEPGSTFKMAVLAAALNEGVIAADDVIDCENGTWYYKGKSLSDYGNHAYGDLTVAEVLKKSSNIGAAKIALELGEGLLEKYLRDFGIGRRTGIGLPGEEAGILYPHDRWSAISATRIAMGHEVAVTALQMLNVATAIANDGFLLRPQVISRVTDARGRTVYERSPEVLARPIDAETAATMRDMLVGVTQEGGTGRRAALEEYTVAGKTGTATKPVPGGYSDTANVASFVGFLPAGRPEISIIVVVDEPQPLHTGGAVAAPVFRKIADETMRYLATQPTSGRTVADG
jgi:cell division protein FtsI (penicillin-binding protein 3)